jgi:hypothetical protein
MNLKHQWVPNLGDVLWFAGGVSIGFYVLSFGCVLAVEIGNGGLEADACLLCDHLCSSVCPNQGFSTVGGAGIDS